MRYVVGYGNAWCSFEEESLPEGGSVGGRVGDLVTAMVGAVLPGSVGVSGGVLPHVRYGTCGVDGSSTTGVGNGGSGFGFNGGRIDGFFDDRGGLSSNPVCARGGCGHVFAVEPRGCGTRVGDVVVGCKEADTNLSESSAGTAGVVGGAVTLDGAMCGAHYVSGDGEREEVVEKGFEAIGLGASCGAGAPSRVQLAPVRGLHYERNKAKREKEKLRKREVGAVPEWRRGAGRGGVSSGVGGPSPVSSVGSAPSLAATVATVTTEVAEELEARRTLAARRVVENRVAVKMGELRLASLQDKDKTEALAKLELARIQERINTTTAKSQASYKKCDSPLDSVGSAGSAGEFAWKQEIRKRDVVEKELDNVKVQLDKMLLIATPEQRRIIAEIPAFIPPTWEELAQEDEDIAPYYTMDEMLAEAAKYAHG